MTTPALDEVAVCVLQAELDDRGTLAGARDALAAVARACGAGPAAQASVVDAVHRLDALLDGRAPDAVAAKRELGRVLQCAVLAATPAAAAAADRRP